MRISDWSSYVCSSDLFIREEFRLNEEAWIGLRFFCKFRKLLWSTGEVHPLQENTLWARQWYMGDAILCKNTNYVYLPIFLTREKSGGIYWQAAGPRK